MAPEAWPRPVAWIRDVEVISAVCAHGLRPGNPASVVTRPLRSGLLGNERLLRSWPRPVRSTPQQVSRHPPYRSRHQPARDRHILSGHLTIRTSLGSGSRRQCHSLVFVPLSFQCQPPCQPSDKQPVTRHYEECIMPVMGGLVSMLATRFRSTSTGYRTATFLP